MENKIGWCNLTWNPVVGCKNYCEYCIHPDSLILMYDLSTKKIKDIKIGDEIIGFDEISTIVKLRKSKKFKKAIVIQKFTTIQDAYEICFESGKKIICSGNHRWLTERGWKYTIGSMQGKNRRPYLTNNNEIMFLGKTSSYLYETLGYKQGYLSGMVKGDGTISYYDYSGRRRANDKIASFRLALKDEEGLIRSKNYLNDFKIYTNDFKFNFNMKGIRTNIKNQVDEIQKIIKFREDEEFYRGFIAGIFDAEGSYTGILRIFNSDIEIIEFIEEGLQKFDFLYKRTIKKSRNKPIYTITLYGGISEQIRFFQLFNPTIKRKRKKILKSVWLRRGQQIVSIKKMNKKMEMIDISTTTNTFIANGLLTHNCYARAMNDRFGFIKNWDIPEWKEKGFNKKFPQKPQKIFIGSMSEIAYWDKVWIQKVIDKIKEYPQHIFQFLTKDPGIYKEWVFPENCWLGVTVTKKDDVKKDSLDHLNDSHLFKKTFISFEPLLEEIDPNDYIGFRNIDWVIIGAESGQRPGKVTPKKEWIKNIVDYCKSNDIPIYLKNSLRNIYPVEIKEFPKTKAELKLF